ncbi:MAG: porin [Rhodospirillales bacterium]|nr:porin [Rhodospirillales bacterium]
MKKILLGTTALVAATTFASGDASAAEKLKLGLGGYFEHTLGVTRLHFDKTGQSAGAQSALREGFENYQDAEVWFMGSTTLDNGITVSVQIELEANTSSDQIDEAYMTISGSFGSFIVGSENLPNYKMHYSAPSVSRVGITSSDATFWFGQPTGFMGNSAISQFNTAYAQDYGRFYANDPLMVSYYTPRIAGFQLGIGFAPDSNEGNNTAGNATTQFQNGISAGLNYVQTFGAFNVAASAGYIQWIEAPASTGQTSPGLIRRDSDAAAHQWQTGLNLGWGGWTIGGAYAATPYGATTTSANSSESWTAVYGVKYMTGPWGFSLNGMNTRAEGATPGSLATNRQREAGADARMYRVEGAWSYQIGPGIQLHGDVMYQNERGELQGSDDVVGWIVTTGILVNF